MSNDHDSQKEMNKNQVGLDGKALATVGCLKPGGLCSLTLHTVGPPKHDEEGPEQRRPEGAEGKTENVFFFPIFFFSSLFLFSKNKILQFIAVS